MIHDRRVPEQEAPRAEPRRCKADGCTCPPCVDGVCEWHDEAQNFSAWPKITSIMQTHEFKYLAWYWQELSKWGSREMIDYKTDEGKIKWIATADMIDLFRKRLHDFGIDPEQTARQTDEHGSERLRHYALRMRALVMDKVMDITGAKIYRPVSPEFAATHGGFRPISDWIDEPDFEEM